jgi:hypothetical protein
MIVPGRAGDSRNYSADLMASLPFPQKIQNTNGKNIQDIFVVVVRIF